MKQFLATPIFLISLIIGCSDDTTVSPVVDDTFLKLTFSEGYCDAEGWVILYTEDGQTALQTIKFNGNAVVDLGELEESQVTLTIITTVFNNGNKFYRINTYYSVKKGSWLFEGYTPVNKGMATVRMNFPLGFYDELLLSTTGFTVFDHRGFSTNTYLTSGTVSKLNKNQTISLFGSVCNFNTNKGYYSLSTEKPFDLGDYNNYTLDLSKPLTLTYVNSNRPFNYISIFAASTEPQIGYLLFNHSYSSSALQQKVFLPDSFPAFKYGTAIQNYENDNSYHYFKISNKPVNNITIPESYLTASYNDVQIQYENITLTGKADYLSGEWFFITNDYKTTVTWIVYTANSVTVIKRPTLPTEVLSQLTDFNVNELWAMSVKLFDQDNISSLNGYIEYSYRNAESNIKSSNEEYSYILYL